ncbi:hypothetical protein RhiirA1_401671 [Rhizophagus irregularis]|uniref:NYN domain-containing protein n=1 Tax=Rhizophagus irregularis TaxID=588596 RepID=A0A2I1EXN2_9GLOM|nr:hypothetical protein RhiirA1_401671 [Rhizophagus irregularis]PKY26875.1 hypothetical protein RhiirB3_389888 [Rhizophagus irregularis]
MTYCDQIYTQRVKGSIFLDFTAVDFERWRVPGSPAKEFEKLINEIKGDLRIDYGRLLRLIINKREVVNMPYLVGSRPPSYDFLWKYVEKEGFEVENFDRDRQNHEKEVDSEIACAMIQTSLLNEPGTIVLISGDKDMCPGINLFCWMSRRGNNLRLYFKNDNDLSNAKEWIRTHQDNVRFRSFMQL